MDKIIQTIKIKYWKDLPKNYTGIVEYSDGIIYYYLNGKSIEKMVLQKYIKMVEKNILLLLIMI